MLMAVDLGRTQEVIQFTCLVYITSLDSQLLIWRRDNILLADFTRTEQLYLNMNRSRTKSEAERS